MVTDSTAALPPALARAAGVRVVSLDVVVGGRRTLDGDLDGADLLAALERGERPVTSQPPPAAFAAAYERAAAEGASAVVSVHLSGALSGTVAAARAAATGAPVPVVVVDSGTVAMGLGFAALAAARAGRADVPDAPPWWRRLRDRFTGASEGFVSSVRGSRPRADDTNPSLTIHDPHSPVQPGADPHDVAAVAAVAQAVADSSSVWFLVDSLDHLRRGGRLSGTSALLGAILQLRPLLTMADGRIVVVGKVRTRRAARARLVQLAVESVLARPQARLAVHHLGNPDAATELVEQVLAATGDRVVETVVTEAGAVLAAHVGPGALAITVADAETPTVSADAQAAAGAALDQPALGPGRTRRRDPSPAPRSAVPSTDPRTAPAPPAWSPRWLPTVPDEPSTAQPDDGPVPRSGG